MADVILKIFEKFGANGLIILALWGTLALLTLIDGFPAGGGYISYYKTALVYALATVGVVAALFFLTWNLWGWPKRLNPGSF